MRLPLGPGVPAIKHLPLGSARERRRASSQHLLLPNLSLALAMGSFPSVSITAPTEHVL